MKKFSGNYISVDHNEALKQNWPLIQRIRGIEMNDAEKIKKFLDGCEEYPVLVTVFDSKKLIALCRVLLGGLNHEARRHINSQCEILERLSRAAEIIEEKYHSKSEMRRIEIQREEKK